MAPPPKKRARTGRTQALVHVPRSLGSNETAARSQVVEIVKYTRVRPVGCSVFAALAMGLEPSERDRMRMEVVEEVVDHEAMEVVERQKAVKLRLAEEERKKRHEDDGGKAGKKRKGVRIAEPEAGSEEVEGEDEGQQAEEDVATGDDATRIKVPRRTGGKEKAKAVKSFVW